MNGTPFKLGTFAKTGGSPFAAIVLGDEVIDLKAAQAAHGRARPNSPTCARCRRCGGLEKCFMRRRTFRSTSTRCCAPA